MIPSWWAKHLIILQRHNLAGQPDHRYVQGEPGSSLPHRWEGTIDHLVQLLNDRAVPQRPGLQTWLHESFIVYKLQTHSWSREWWMGCYRLQHHIPSRQEIKPVPNAHQKTKKSSGKSNMPIFLFLGILPKQNTALLSLCPFFSPSQAWYLSCSWWFKPCEPYIFLKHIVCSSTRRHMMIIVASHGLTKTFIKGKI